MTDDICGATNRDGEPCALPAGWGTDHAGEGRCKHHGGAATAPTGGAPEGNGNAQTHSLHADRGLFYERLSDEKQAAIDELEAALIERYREYHGRDPDAADVRDCFEIAVGYAQRDFAREWMAEQMAETGNPLLHEVEIDFGEDASMTMEEPHDVLDAVTDLRREDRLTRKHKGLEKDPDSQRAEAESDLADAMMENLTSAYER